MGHIKQAGSHRSCPLPCLHTTWSQTHWRACSAPETATVLHWNPGTWDIGMWSLEWKDQWTRAIL